MSKEYVLNKLKELETAIDSISDKELKELVQNNAVLKQNISIPEMFAHMWKEESTTMYHIHSMEFLRQT